jgi:phosphomannomutase/phosphoglucomutase
MKLVPKVGADFGVAQDGDADRAIFIDEKGAYITGDQSLTLGAKYSTRKGSVAVTPVTSSSAFDDVVKKNKGTVIHSAVGSPIIARIMIDKKSVFGGEGNGGLIFPEFQYCRDSAMSIAKFLEFLAKENKKLSQLINELPKYETFNTKLNCPNDMKEFVMKTLIEITKKDKNIIKVDETDGIKLYLNDGWVLMRPSGTEPIFRVYSESIDKKRAEEITSNYKKITQDIINKNS